MAPTQVELHVIPQRALTAFAGQSLTRESLATGDWWRGATLPAGWRAHLTAMAGTVTNSAAEPGLERWGSTDGDAIEVRSAEGGVVRIVARVDAKRPSARFAAALITFVQATGATLVRADGTVLRATAGDFGAALRASPSWRPDADPASRLRDADDDA